MLAHNLGRHTLTAAGADWSAATVGSLRRKLLTMPARLVSSARRLRLRASANWPWADALTSALTAIRGDPRARLTGSPPPPVRHDPTHTAPEPLRPRSAAPRQPSTPRNTQNPQDPPNTIATTSTQRRPPKLAPSGLRVRSKHMLRNMSFDEQGRLTDPRALRAVAHPARLAILELLQQQETATATQCAEHAGLSPSACSYHLRSLARWGLVEEAEGGRGRERPWRARVDRLRVESETLGSESARAAANLFTEQIVLRGEQWVRDFLRRRDRLPSDLRRGCLIDNRFLSLTPAEARDLWQRIDAMLDEYTDKRRDAPDDAVAFRLVLRGFPAAGPQPQADGQ